MLPLILDIQKRLILFLALKPIQEGEGKKQRTPSPISVFPLNVKTNPKNFLTFSFNPFATLMQNFNAKNSTNHKLLNLNTEICFPG